MADSEDNKRFRPILFTILALILWIAVLISGVLAQIVNIQRLPEESK